jgi:biopolymer transport protein ExbB
VSTLFQYWSAGGPLMFPLGALSFAIWLWMVILHLELGRANASSRGLHALLHRLPVDGLPEAVRDWAAASPGPVARAAQYATGGERDADAVRSRMVEARSAEIPRFEREILILKAMVAAAPLLGLLGTVMGMIATFSALSVHGTASMELLSGGISEALVTTQVGLVVALPGVVGVAVAARRLADLGAAFDRLELHLSARFARRRADFGELSRAVPGEESRGDQS